MTVSGLGSCKGGTYYATKAFDDDIRWETLYWITNSKNYTFGINISLCPISIMKTFNP